MNIYLRELTANKKALIIWSLAFILFLAMGMQKYGAMVAPGGEAALELMESLPTSLKKIFGLSTLDVTNIVGYYSILYLYLILITAIHAATLGVKIISKEESDKTCEFLFVKPLKRSKIVTSKLLAALTNVVIINLVSLISGVLTLNIIENELFIKELLLLHTGMFFVQLLFLVLGVFIALINKKTKKNSAKIMGILLFTYFLSMIIDISDKLNILEILTPFKYFDPKEVIPNNSLNIFYIGFIIILIILSLLFGYKKFQKRDLSL